MGPRSFERGRTEDLDLAGVIAAMLQWGRVLENAESYDENEMQNFTRAG
jgi:hypothetical protein